MSWQASAWARGVKTGSPSRKAVLLVLAEYCDEWGYCWPSQTRVAEDCELSDRQVRTLLDDLAERGLITILQSRDRYGRRKNLYRLAFEAPAGEALPESHPVLLGAFQPWRWIDDENATPPENISGGSANPPEVCGMATGSLRQGHRKPTSGDPTIEPSKEPARARASGAAADGTAPPSAEAGEAESGIADDGLGKWGGGAAETVQETLADRWRAGHGKLRQTLGEVVFRQIFDDAIAAEDDGRVLTIWMPTAFLAAKARQDHGALLDRVYRRRVDLVVDARSLAKRRRREAQLQDATPRRQSHRAGGRR